MDEAEHTSGHKVNAGCCDETASMESEKQKRVGQLLCDGMKLRNVTIVKSDTVTGLGGDRRTVEPRSNQSYLEDWFFLVRQEKEAGRQG